MKWPQLVFVLVLLGAVAIFADEEIAGASKEPSETFQAQVEMTLRLPNVLFAYNATIYQDLAMKSIRTDESRAGTVSVEALFRYDLGVGYTISADNHHQFCQKFNLDTSAFMPYFHWVPFAKTNGSTCVDKGFPHKAKGIIYTGVDGVRQHTLCLTGANRPLWDQSIDTTTGLITTTIFKTWRPLVSNLTFEIPRTCVNNTGPAKVPSLLKELISRSPTDAVGCTPAPYGSVCIAVAGSGYYVTNISVIRASTNPAGICYYHSNVWDPSNNWQYGQYNGCTFISAYNEYGFDFNFPGGEVCGAWYENYSQQQGGDVCETISG